VVEGPRVLCRGGAPVSGLWRRRGGRALPVGAPRSPWGGRSRGPQGWWSSEELTCSWSQGPSTGPPRRGWRGPPALVVRREERAFRGLSMIGNPYYLPAGVSRGAGADPLLSFHPSRVLTHSVMTGPRSCLLPCTLAQKRPGWPLSLCFGVSMSRVVGFTLSSVPTLMGFWSFSFPTEGSIFRGIWYPGPRPLV
jgi:hypothetical protein